MIKFYFYLASLEDIKFEYPEQIFLPANITFKSTLRILQESNIDIPCILENKEKGIYACEISNVTNEISNIKINNIEHGNFDIKTSPLAEEYINNILDLEYSTDTLDPEKLKLITLKDATVIKNNSISFTINGTIDNVESVTFLGEEVTIKAKQIPNNNSIELNCTLTNINGNNFNLICKKNNSITYDMDSAFIRNGNQILTVDFKEGANSIVSKASSGGRVYNRKSSKGGLSGGIIALIAIVPVVALGILVAIILMLRKSVIQQAIPNTSSTANIVKEP